MVKLIFPQLNSKISSINKTLRIVIFLLVILNPAFAQSPRTIRAGSFIVNMGVVPQTIANGLKPYGLIYDLIKNYNVPVYWIIGDSKGKDGVDFNYNGVDYKGGTFIIPHEYITSTVAGRISFFGVTGTYTTGNLTLTPDYILTSVPTWTLDEQNGQLAQPYFANAGIPITAYNWLAPSALGVCNDVFIMPHADPTWAVHGNLFNWNLQYKGSIWLGCHAGSALANTYNPATPSEQMNFLMTKVDRPGFNPVSGGTAYCENSLVLWTHHTTGSIPYNTLTATPPPAPANGTLATAQDPVAQYMGVSDLAQLNGSEQVYLPVLGGAWLPSTQIICYDPSQANVPATSPGTAVLIAYGRGFGDPNRGYIMYEACHSLNKGTAGDVPAQRVFFNWSFLATIEKVPVITSITGMPVGNIFNAQPYPHTYPLSVNYSSPVSSGFSSVTWSITRVDNGASAGSFSPNGTLASTNTVFTPGNTATNLECNLTVKIIDACGRSTFETIPVTIKACNVTASGVVTSPNCFGATGSIAVTVNGGNGTLNYSYSGPTSGNGSSATSPFTVSGLAAGTYNFTITDATLCTASFSVLITTPAQLNATTTVTNVLCNGGTGSIDLSVAGGTAPYTYNWGGGVTTEDRANVPAGTYNVTVTDNKGCTKSASATVGQPASSLTITGNITNVSCFGGSNGAINITASGGTGTFLYDWADIAGTNNVEDRTGLAAATYQVTVTDASGCTASNSFTILQPAALILSTIVTQPTCPPATPPTPPVPAKNSDGAINLTVSGGTSGFTYVWTGPNSFTASTEDISGLLAGTYSVTVTDSKGCVKSLTVILNYLNPNPVQPGSITK